MGDYAGFEFDHATERRRRHHRLRRRQVVHLLGLRRRTATDTQYPNAGVRETYRVVDLNGERAVISVSQSDESIDPAMIKEARAIFDSIVFVRPDE